ncbi:hypothetical protein A3F37_02355 [Candidatus Saccharibacteria bacterium RIFCSPHIGHO2_12_FULL_41_12]|nr:MAG: hypothetical protein A3F37_02355 [Candidatus Saccharibacteria bacterium RIFCSPHIGHO2_12_FULL_41_12]
MTKRPRKGNGFDPDKIMKRLEPGNREIRRAREESEARADEEEQRLQEQEALLDRQSSPGPPKKQFNLFEPVFIRPIIGLPWQAEQVFTHNYDLVASDVGVIAVFAGEPRLDSTIGMLSESRLGKSVSGSLALFGKLPKNLVKEFGEQATEANPQCCRLLNSAESNNPNFGHNPRNVGINMGVHLPIEGEFDISEVNLAMGGISIGPAYSLDGYMLGQERQKRPEAESKSPVYS